MEQANARHDSEERMAQGGAISPDDDFDGGGLPPKEESKPDPDADYDGGGLPPEEDTKPDPDADQPVIGGSDGG